MIQGRHLLAASCLALLAACQRHEAITDGAAVIDEPVGLERQPAADTAARTLTVHEDSIVVAIADEQLTDVRLRIAATDEDGHALDSVEVENNLAGSGVEIAVLSVPEDARVNVTLTGTAD